MAGVNRFAPALAVLVAVGVLAAVVGAAALANQFVGVWAGVMVAGLSVTIVGVVALFALGTIDDEPDDVVGGRV